MSPNGREDLGLPDGVGQAAWGFTSNEAPGTQGKRDVMQEAIDTLIRANTEDVFYHYFDLLCCLGKLGNDFRDFKRASMLKPDHGWDNAGIDMIIGDFQADVHILSLCMTPSLDLELPVQYQRRLEEASAYILKYDPSRQDTLETPQEQEQIMERSQEVANESATIQQVTPQGLLKTRRFRELKARGQQANKSRSFSPLEKSSKSGKKDISDLLQYDPRKSHKADSGVVSSSVHSDPATQLHKKTTSLPENILSGPCMSSVNGHLDPHGQYPFATPDQHWAGPPMQWGAQGGMPLAPNVFGQINPPSTYDPTTQYGPSYNNVPTAMPPLTPPTYVDAPPPPPRSYFRSRADYLNSKAEYLNSKIDYLSSRNEHLSSMVSRFSNDIELYPPPLLTPTIAGQFSNDIKAWPPPVLNSMAGGQSSTGEEAMEGAALK